MPPLHLCTKFLSNMIEISESLEITTEIYLFYLLFVGLCDYNIINLSWEKLVFLIRGGGRKFV